MIRLTSFREARELPREWVRLSGARWAPDFARNWGEVEWAAPVYPDGSPIKLRDFGENPLPKYREYMLELYRSRWSSIRQWIPEQPELVALCCWCPYTKTARAQLEQFGSFHCHLGVVGEVLTGAEVEWKFGGEHEARLVQPLYSPSKFVRASKERS